MKTLKAAIIGAGQIALKAHIPAYRSYAQPVEVVALCGRDLQKTKSLAEELRIPHAYDDVAQMLRACAPDMVSICTPNNLHYPQVMSCLDAGVHVLCEKPPALTYAEAKAMQEKSDSVNRILAYNLHCRQMEPVRIMKKYIDEGGFGKIYHIRASFLRRRGIPGWGSFTNKEIQGGGALMDIGIHVLDLALYLLNYPGMQAVLANTYDHIGKKGGVGLMGSWDPERFNVEDGCFAHITLDNGASITLECAFALNAGRNRDFNLQVYGSKMGATLEPFTLFTERENELEDIDLSTSEQTDTQQKNIHLFIDACRNGNLMVCNAGEGAFMQQVIETVYVSAERKRGINF
jgi:predicted dehydrogenase